LAVGEGGRAVGIDVSAEQLAVARTACADLPAAAFVEDDATGLDVGDATFNGIASINTLEYIADMGAALGEMRRVLKPGARVALISVLWDHFRYHGAELALNEQMLDAFRAHCPHQMLPLELPSKLEAHGFGGIRRESLAFFNGALNDNAYALWAAKIIVVFAIGQGIAEDDARRWFQQLEDADEEGRFGFVSVPILTSAIAI
jgi:ubiquinone/menaquinone biosynthesis C-methylase UbiE